MLSTDSTGKVEEPELTITSKKKLAETATLTRKGPKDSVLLVDMNGTTPNIKDHHNSPPESPTELKQSKLEPAQLVKRLNRDVSATLSLTVTSAH